MKKRGNVYHIIETPEIDEISNSEDAKEDGVSLNLEVQEIKRETKKIDLNEPSLEMICPESHNQSNKSIQSIRSYDHKAKPSVKEPMKRPE